MSVMVTVEFNLKPEAAEGFLRGNESHPARHAGV